MGTGRSDKAAVMRRVRQQTKRCHYQHGRRTLSSLGCQHGARVAAVWLACSRSWPRNQQTLSLSKRAQLRSHCLANELSGARASVNRSRSSLATTSRVAAHRVK